MTVLLRCSARKPPIGMLLRVTVLGRTKVGPKHFLLATAAVALVLLFAADPASAHHVMGKRPETFAQGVLSGLGHPIIGLDHLAAVTAVGCLAALYRIGALLAIGFVLAVIAGVAVHVQGVTFPGVELLVALSVVVLGACLVWRSVLPPALALGLFVLAGLLHGSALGESIVGAEPAPLYAYFIGLAVMQSAIAYGAMAVVRLLAHPTLGDPAPVRLVGAGIAGIGLALAVGQLSTGA
jgi:urease accessory protein